MKKMPVPHRNTIVSTILVSLLICLSITLAEVKKEKSVCPIGFDLAYTGYEKPICYRLKGREAFNDIFEDCAGNLYTSELYHSLNITKKEYELWSGHKSLYPGGPFIDWSFSPSIGKVLTSTYDVKYNPSLGIEDELCVVIHPINNFTAVRCTEKHHRYCMVEPYEDTLSKCEELTDYYRFWSPKATCLTPVTVKGGKVRASWSQAQILCAKRGGSLLHRGWRYANNPLLHVNKTEWSDPLGIEATVGEEFRWINDEDGNNKVPVSEWGFDAEENMSNNTLVALRDNAWHLVNSSYIFMDVICERSIHLRNVSLNLTVEGDQVILSVNDSVDESNIHCFTDAIVYAPTIITKIPLDENKYSLKTKSDGMYWCIHRDSRNFRVSQSNKVLFVRENSVENLYAIKIRLKRKYRFENIDKIYRIWEKKVKEYIYYRTKYVERFGEISTTGYEAMGILQNFKRSMGDESGEGSFKDTDVIYLVKIKRLFLDGRTVLLHVQLNPMMKPVPPGYWEDLEVVYMRPAYFCNGDALPPATRRVALGHSVITAGCRNHTCLGDFNTGVSFVITRAENCTIKPPEVVTRNFDIAVDMPTAQPKTDTTVHSDMERHLDESLEVTIGTPCTEDGTETTTDALELTTVTTPYYSEEITTTEETTSVPIHPIYPKPPPTRPTTTTTTTSTTTSTTTERPRAPEEQLQQVMEDLEAIINNETIPIMVNTVSDAVDQVDSLLQIEDELEIPGQLLHLVDELAARVDLNGSHEARAVANNIAMLMADASPDSPVKGLRIAAQGAYQVFSSDDFEIISEEVNSTHLTSDESEAVVHLPESVAISSRRISFVVFRTDRAFMSSHGLYSVNSRVLSIKIEDLTEFADGEVIDIHLRPMADEPSRNQTRSCAYWHFLDDNTGYWSQDGCIFIPSSEPGQLDTCRCDHLTHFAEVLVPKTVFSERNETILEIISIIGCCLSIIGLLGVGITAAMFRSWRRDFSNKIWLQLCIAMFILITCFLVALFTRFNQYDLICFLIGVLMHYSTLASFCWMLVAAVLSYRRLVLVFTRDASHKLLRASAFSWGTPCAIVGVLLAASPHAYSGQFEEISPSSSFCYPSGLGLWLTVYAPIAIMLFANWTLFILIVRSVFASRRIQRHGDANEALRCASVSCLLVFLFGLPWIFGLFASNIVAAYLFSLTATFQGFVLFIFFVLGNKKTRDLWLNKLKIKQTQKIPVTSSTYTNNKSQNSASEWRGGRSTPAAIEANASKPRSLSSPDESRFS